MIVLVSLRLLEKKFSSITIHKLFYIDIQVIKITCGVAGVAFTIAVDEELR